MLALVVDTIEEVGVEWPFLSRVAQAIFVAGDKLARAVLVLGLVVLEGDSDGVATALGVVRGGLEWNDERQLALTEIIPLSRGLHRAIEHGKDRVVNATPSTLKGLEDLPALVAVGEGVVARGELKRVQL